MKAILVVVLLASVGCGNLHKDVHNLQTQNNEQQTQIEQILALLADLRASLGAEIEAANAGLEGAQSTANILAAQIATLEANVQIAEIVDPCGDGPGYDEVVLRTSAGFMAYFETGSKRFLALLPPGNYQTTDQQACSFSISAQGELND